MYGCCHSSGTDAWTWHGWHHKLDSGELQVPERLLSPPWSQSFGLRRLDPLQRLQGRRFSLIRSQVGRWPGCTSCSWRHLSFSIVVVRAIRNCSRKSSSSQGCSNIIMFPFNSFYQSIILGYRHFSFLLRRLTTVDSIAHSFYLAVGDSGIISFIAQNVDLVTNTICLEIFIRFIVHC